MRAAAALYIGLALAQRALSLLLLPFVTRSMDTSEYGAVSLLVAVGGLVALILGGSFEQAVYRWSVAHESRTDAAEILWLSAVWLRVAIPLVSVAVAAILWFTEGTILQVPNKLWAIEIVATALSASATFLAMPSLRARERLVFYSIVALSSIVPLVLSKVWLVIVLGWGARGWVLSDLIAGATAYVAALVFFRAERVRASRPHVRRLAAFVVPLVPHLLAFWALGSLTRPLMALSLPLAAVGTFSAAFNIAAVGTLLAAELNRAAMLQYSRDSLPGPSAATAGVARLQIIVALLLPTLVSGGAAIAGQIILAPEYWGAVQLVGILSFGSLFYGLYLIPMNFLTQTAGITGKSWIASAVGALVILASLNAIAAVSGTVGVAWVNVAGYAVMAAMAFVIVRRERLQIRWRGTVPPVWALVVLLCLAVLACAWCVVSTPGIVSAAGGAALVLVAAGAAFIAHRARARPIA